MNAPPLKVPTRRQPLPEEDPRLAGLAAIRQLRKRANQGLYVLVGFMVLSIGAQYDFSFLPSFPPALHRALGTGPTAGFISMLLVVYLFSAVIMILARMMKGEGDTGGIVHLGYLGGFYFFYHLSGELGENIWAVLAAGLTILCLEAYQLWCYCQDEIRREQEVVAQRNRFPSAPDDPPNAPPV